MTGPTTLESLLATVPLARLPRTGWLQAGVAAPESVAAHSLGVALVALALGPRVRPALDVDRAVALAVVHDAPEALISDLPRSATELLPDGAKRTAERAAAEALLPGLSELALERYREVSEGASREARFTKLCDRLHMGVMWIAYRRAGARGLESFATSVLELDCSEFPVCDELRQELAAASEELDR